MKLGKLASLIDSYTSVDSISVMLNNKVIGLYNRDDFYITITGELENVSVSKYFLRSDENMYIITLDVDSFKTVFKI